MVGIYKITSPSGSVYIGQSWDINRRKRGHKSLSKKMTGMYLYHSISKYGFDKHLFEIIHELPNDVSQNILDKYEDLYITRHRECGLKIMNLKEGGSRGKILNTELKKRLSDAAKRRGNNLPKGFKHSDELKQRFSIERKGMASPNKGRTFSIDVKKKQSLAKLGRTGILCPNSKKIVCTKTGRIYNSIGEAAKDIGMKRTTLNSQLNGCNPNKTTLQYYKNG